MKNAGNLKGMYYMGVLATVCKQTVTWILREGCEGVERLQLVQVTLGSTAINLRVP
jgi:hypothetical protein